MNKLESPEAATLHAVLRDANLRFPERPRFVADLDLFDLPDGLGVYVKGLTAPVCLRGRTSGSAMAFLRKAFDRRQTLDEMLDDCPADPGQVAVLKALTILHRKGALREHDRADEADPDPIRLFFDRTIDETRYNRHPDAALAAVSSCVLTVIANGLVGFHAVELLLRSGARDIRLYVLDGHAFPDDLVAASDRRVSRMMPLPIGPKDGDAVAAFEADLACSALLVTATSGLANAFFDWVNARCLAAGIDWLRAHVDGSAFELGPHVQPRRAPCFTCLTMRRRSTDPFAVEEQLWQDDKARAGAAARAGPVGEYPPGAAFAAGHLVAEALRILTFYQMPITTGQVVTGSLLTFQTEAHPVLRVPTCPSCGAGR